MLSERNKAMVAVMYMDLDRFKYVNDTFGHIVGDLLLQEASKRIKSCVRAIDTVVRIGGDEFTVILGELNGKEDIVQITEKIIDTLSQPFFINSHELNISVSIGIAFYPDDGEQNDELIKKADEAMYEAKQQGKNRYVFYDTNRR